MAGSLGIHGLGERNDAGEEFLWFFASYQLTIMNSWFKEIHLGTWMHPAIKKHMIDFVMRARQHMFCTDVQVMRGASCWYHRMITAKLRVETVLRKKKGDPFIPFAIHLLHSSTFRDDYMKNLT